MTTTKEQAQEALFNFAQELEVTIGTDETTALLNRLTKFIRETPESIVLLRNTVHSNAKQFDELLTKQGVETIGMMIQMSESGAIFDNLF